MLNAISTKLSQEVLAALREFDQADAIGAIVINGNARAFAAGADIEEIAEKTFNDLYSADIFADWDKVRTISKPIVAAIGEYALGGG
jgi:enoyl-CoA hydratase